MRRATKTPPVRETVALTVIVCARTPELARNAVRRALVIHLPVHGWKFIVTREATEAECADALFWRESQAPKGYDASTPWVILVTVTATVPDGHGADLAAWLGDQLVAALTDPKKAPAPVDAWLVEDGESLVIARAASAGARAVEEVLDVA